MIHRCFHPTPCVPSPSVTTALLGLLALAFTAVSCDTGSVAEPPDPKDCQQGLANSIYPCSDVNLLAFVSLEEMGETEQDANDIWGWTDPKTGKEYALLGLTNGVAIFDITDGEKPVYVGKLPEPDKIVPRNILAGAAAMGEAPSFAYHDDQDSTGKGAAAWRDIKTYRNTMYVVSDESGRGMQVYDLEKLRDIPASAMPATLQHDVHYDLFGNAHNIAINEESGFAYVIGSYRGGTCASNGGLHIIDIRDRLNPQYAGCHVESTAGGYIRAGYIHDTQCVIYKGPDAAYQGREICVSAAEKRLLVSDVTDKANPRTIAVYLYPGNRYAHQGWLTENHRTFFLNDELDELQNEHNTRTYVIDLSDLDNPTFTGYVQQSTNSIDHNLYVRGNRMYQSNYMAGLRIFDITTPTPSGIKEAGFFDTTPALTDKKFEGTWSVFPWFTKGKVALSDIHQGFFVLEYNP
jgi:choice-of-anchor B domain-containing protein